MRVAYRLSELTVVGLVGLTLALPAAAGAIGENQRSAERARYTAQESLQARPDGIRDARFPADSVEDFRHALSAATKADDEPWLVLSGGGENGAYAAGLLNGWTETGSRPRFGVVTGISTGALIAPLAFAGSAYDGALKEAYTTITAADVFEFGATPTSLVDTWPLTKLIERFVTPDLLRSVAAEHEAGRRLFVLTTNIDTQRPVAWNMGAIAAEGGEGSLKLFRSILLASAAIPGVFPPVEIGVAANGKAFKEMHADGGITTPFFVAPEAVVAAPAGSRPLTDHPIYVVVNAQLTPEFQVAQGNTLSVLGRSLSVAVKAASRAAMGVHAGFAQRAGLDMLFTHIDGRFRPSAQGPFDGEYMKALYAHGLQVAKEGSAFRRNPFERPPMQTAERR